jgi:hypothetical protein
VLAEAIKRIKIAEVQVTMDGWKKLVAESHALGGEDANQELIQLTNAGVEPRDVFEIAALDAVVPMGGEVGAKLPSRVPTQSCLGGNRQSVPTLEKRSLQVFGSAHIFLCARATFV